MKSILSQLPTVSVASLSTLIKSWACSRACFAHHPAVAVAELWDVGRHTPHKEKLAHALMEQGHPLQVFRAIHTRATADEDLTQVFAFVDEALTFARVHPGHVATANLPMMHREMAKRAMRNATLANQYLDCLTTATPALAHTFVVHCLAADPYNAEFVCASRGLAPTPELMFDAICAKTNDLLSLGEFEDVKPLFAANLITTDQFLHKVTTHNLAHHLFKVLAGQSQISFLTPKEVASVVGVLSVHPLGERFLPNARLLLSHLENDNGHHASAQNTDDAHTHTLLTQWMERSSLALATQQCGTTRTRAKM